MHIHFICTGNVFRSRLAEAYLRSLKHPKISKVSSSGIQASHNKWGPITWYAARIINNYNLHSFVTHTWSETTDDQIRNADVIIFIDKSHFDHVAKKHNLENKTYEIWNIPDLGEFGFTKDKISFTDDNKRMRLAEEIFKEIQKKVNSLLKKLET